jgi:UDP-glucose 4-epimerase
MTVLITGGAGYIGSHTCVELLNAGMDVVVIDNLSNGHVEALSRVEYLTGKTIPFIEAVVRDQVAIRLAVSEYQCESVIHFAGLKAVGESVQVPLTYYENNFDGTLSLLAALEQTDVRKVIFSSSATVYGQPTYLPIDESHPTSATNPYGRTKLMVEWLLQDLFVSDNSWTIGILRYFNPVGAHKSGLIGEDPKGVPNNLMPYVAQVATGRFKELKVWGNDYDTGDGTGERDYIHVVDLARGHLRALENLNEPQCSEINLGTGNSYSVLDMIRGFEKASEKSIPYRFEPRRPGDIATCYADPSKAKNLIDWQSIYTLDEMCRDHWNWQKQNPQGFANVSIRAAAPETENVISLSAKAKRLAVNREPEGSGFHEVG